MTNSWCLIWPRPNDVAYTHAIGRIKKRHVRALATHEPGKVRGFARVATQQTMLAELP